MAALNNWLSSMGHTGHLLCTGEDSTERKADYLFSASDSKHNDPKGMYILKVLLDSSILCKMNVENTCYNHDRKLK